MNMCRCTYIYIDVHVWHTYLYTIGIHNIYSLQNMYDIYIYIHVSFDTTMLGPAHTDNMHVCMYASLDHVCVCRYLL